MTGNLSMMVKFRDLQVAEDFSKMAELGYLDKEFTMYGTAYWQDNQRWYMVSSKQEQLYDFISSDRAKDKWATPIMSMTKICPVPAGSEEDIALTVKTNLANQLQETFPITFFSALENLFQNKANNSAESLLRKVQESIEGVFIEEKLQLFEGLVWRAYDRMVLTQESYKRFCSWLAKMRREMEDDVVIKDVFKRTLYGIAYEEQGTIKFYSNANKSSIYTKCDNLLKKGFLVTPIFVKSYWFNYKYTLDDVRADFKQHLMGIYDKNYIAILKAIHQLPHSVPIAQYTAIKESLRGQDATNQLEVLTFFEKKWGLN